MNLAGMSKKSFDSIKKIIKRTFGKFCKFWTIRVFYSTQQDENTSDPYYNSWCCECSQIECIEFAVSALDCKDTLSWVMPRIVFIEQRLSRVKSCLFKILQCVLLRPSRLFKILQCVLLRPS